MLVYQALELDLMKFLSALCNGHELQIVRPHVVGAGANDLVVLALLDGVRRPATGAGDHEHWCEHDGFGADCAGTMERC